MMLRAIEAVMDPNVGENENSRSRRIRDISILVVLMLVTRLPVLGIGEPDSALFSTGAKQWLLHGPNALSIYSAKACAFYYATISALVRSLDFDAVHCQVLMSILSVLGGLATALFGYLIGLRFVGNSAALRGILLFVFAPGFWWVSAEPHPQAVSIGFAFAALWLFLRFLEGSGPMFGLAAAMCLAIGVAVKNDAVLIIPALLGIVLWADPKWRNVFSAVLIGASACVVALLLDRIASGDASAPITGGQQAVHVFWRIPDLPDLLRETTPIVFGLGAVTAIALAVSIALVLRTDPEKNRWLAMLAAWCLPGYFFWLCIAGNNVRHVLAFGLPLFWIGGKCLKFRYVFACVALSLLVPGNSNVFLFPSPNVPASKRLLAEKEAVLRDLAQTVAARPSCFVGSYTNDYLANILVDMGGRIDQQASRTDTSAALITMPNRASIKLKRINPSREQVQLGSCESVEYSSNGRKVRVFGDEWHVPVV